MILFLKSTYLFLCSILDTSRNGKDLQVSRSKEGPEIFVNGRQPFERYSWEQVVADAFDARMGSHGTVRRCLSGAVEPT